MVLNRFSKKSLSLAMLVALTLALPLDLGAADQDSDKQSRWNPFSKVMKWRPRNPFRSKRELVPMDSVTNSKTTVTEPKSPQATSRQAEVKVTKSNQGTKPSAVNAELKKMYEDAGRDAPDYLKVAETKTPAKDAGSKSTDEIDPAFANFASESVPESGLAFPVTEATTVQQVKSVDTEATPVSVSSAPMLPSAEKNSESPFGFPNGGIAEADAELARNMKVNEPVKAEPVKVVEKKTAELPATELPGVEIEAPQIVPEPEQAAPKPAPKSHASKMQRIAERRGLTGFKGFCPVVLRDERDLRDATMEYGVEHDGKTYYVCSEEALMKFQQHPERYAPAASGRDVVLRDDAGLKMDGRLDYSVWYQGRLYMFTTKATLLKFSAQPHLYATAK